jgi:hypothetical protein
MLRVMRGVLLAGLVVACGKSARRELDLDLIKITGQGTLRTDTVGDLVSETATFVLVDAENTGNEGAFVTLAGDLADGSGHPVGEFKATSLWIPAGESRTFALVDRERKARPEASAAKILVRQVTMPAEPPAVYADHIREIEDNGKLVVQGVLHNDAKRPRSDRGDRFVPRRRWPTDDPAVHDPARRGRRDPSGAVREHAGREARHDLRRRHGVLIRLRPRAVLAQQRD